MAKVKVKYSKNFNELVKAKNAGKLTAVLQGGSSSGKTYSAIQFLVYECLNNPNTSCIIGRLDRATCKLSCTKDLIDILTDQYQVFDPDSWNKSDLQYTFKNGSTISFVGFSDPAKARGPRVDYSMLNEATEIPEDTYKQVSMRTKKMCIIDFNPVSQAGWFYDLKKNPDCHYFISTFRDNPAIPAASRKVIESYEPTTQNKANGTADSYLWDVYALGKPAKRQGAIYPRWIETDHWPQPMACQFREFGLDFGYSQDPTALIEFCLYNDEIYLREWLYETELIPQKNPYEPSIPSVEGRFEELNVPRDVKIWADGARPEVIEALRVSGYNIQGAEKGSGSILKGINLIKQHKIKVFSHSMNLKAELNQYAWKQQGYNVYTDQPEDKFNHLLDGARYVALSRLKPRQSQAFINKQSRRTRPKRAGGLVSGF